MKNNSIGMKLLMAVVTLAVLTYFGIQAYLYFDNPLTTTLAYNYQVEEGMELSGYVVRDEQVLEEEPSGLYAELDAFLTMVRQRGGNEGYLSVSLATCRVLDELAKQNKLTFRQTHWNMVVHRDD